MKVKDEGISNANFLIKNKKNLLRNIPLSTTKIVKRAFQEDSYICGYYLHFYSKVKSNVKN